jgi:predicted O-methyltransferase YrrM
MPASLNAVDRPQGMRGSEVQVICDLIKTRRFTKLLEVGMANGSSSVALLRVLSENGGGSLTSIDPYQLAPVGSVKNDNDDGYSGEGIANVKRAGFAHMHTLLAEPDYIALPGLVERGEKFDFIFIDGYHSFDYAFVDFFFADLLLRVGGVIAFHDSSYPAVYKVCKFITRNKEYRLIGPRPEPMHASLPKRLVRRARYWFSGENAMFRERRLVWCSVAAFEKIRDSQCKQRVVQDF